MVHPVECQIVEIALGALRIGYQVADLHRIDPVTFEDVRDGTGTCKEVGVTVAEDLSLSAYEIPRQLHMVQARGILHDSLKRVGEWCVTDVMHHGGRPDRERVLLRQTDGLRHPACQIIRPETMLETRMVGTGEHEVPHTQLLHTA